MKPPPASIFGIRIRVDVDNTYWLSRKHREAELYMNAHYTSLGPLRWAPTSIGSLPSIDALTEKFRDRECYIIGKGPSLDNVTSSTFVNKEAPILCINESIHKIEALDLPNPTFVITQDCALEERCVPKRAVALITPICSHWFSKYANKYIIYPQEFGAPNAALTVVFAIAFIKDLGTIHVNLVSFDAIVNGDTDYAECIDYEPTRGGNPDRFKRFKRHIDKALGHLAHSYITPSQ